jgi:WD40 repeat protein/predicted Ser/Thr protein kinase
MGVVYKAQQASLGRTVALKMLPFGPFTRDDFVKRFHTEAQAAAKLQHPNIVAIYEVGEREGQHFFSMEFVDGPNLAEVVGSQPMAETRAVRIVRSIAEALHFAHEHGILHRDLKPSNVLLDPLDQPKVTDFGLAKDLAGDSELTMTGQALGSPSYIPPEQAEGRRDALSPRSDVYSLGAVLYHLATGRPPFAGESITATMRQVINEEPVSPRLLNPALSRDLEVVCLKCLEKEPARRYASARELAEELARFQNDEPIRARPVSAAEKIWRWCRRRPALASVSGAALTFLVAGLIVSLWQWHRAEQQAGIVLTALVQAKIQRAEEFLARDQSGRGLAWLAHVLREDAANQVASERLLWALTARDFPLPLTSAMSHGDRVLSARFHPAGDRVLTASKDGTAQLWDAATGEAVGVAMRHTDAVTSIEFSRDGQRILTLSADRTVRLWSARDGTSLGPVVRHHSGIVWAGFFPDGDRFVTASFDGTARAWSSSSGEPLTPPMRHGSRLAAACLSADGRWIMTSSEDRSLQLWNATSGEAFREPTVRDKTRSTFLRFSPDSQFLYFTDGLHRVLFLDLQTRELIGAPPSHARMILTLNLNRSGSRLVTGSEDRTARVWDTRTGQAVTPPLPHEGAVMAAVFSPEGDRVATASADGTARIWDSATGRPLSEPMRHDSAVADIEFSGDGKRVVTASWDGTAKAWDVLPGNAKPAILNHESVVARIAYDAEGHQVVTSSEDKSARVWDVSSGEPITERLRHELRVTMSAFSPDGRRVITGSWDGTACVWDVLKGIPLTESLIHSNFVLCVAYAPDGRRVLTFDLGGAVRLWNAATGKLEIDCIGHSNEGTDARFTRDGQRILTASRDNTARIWSAQSGKELLPPLRHSEAVRSAQFDAAEQRILTAAEDWTARVWSARTGQPLTPPMRHLNKVYYAEFSPDGRMVATASADGTARLWNADTGAPLPVFFQHAAEVYVAAFSPDGRRIVTASADQTGRIWDINTGHALSEPLRHQGNLRWAQFSPDGKLVATASEDNTARIWRLPDGMALAPIWLADLAEAVAGLRVDRTGALTHVSPNELITLRRRQLNGVHPELSNDWLAWFFSDRASRQREPWTRTASSRQ